MSMPTDADDPSPDEGDGDGPADRDERRVRALERLFRKAVAGERRLSSGAMKKIGDALRGDPPED